jgi:hypothetical protein
VIGNRQRDCGGRGQRSKGECIEEWERRCRDCYGRNDKKDEGVLDAARELNEGRQLQDVKRKKRCRQLRAEACTRRIAQAKDDVEPSGCCNKRETDADVETEAQPEIDVTNRSQLSCDAKPAQPHRGLQAQPALAGLSCPLGL